jgi:hypothetical protein
MQIRRILLQLVVQLTANCHSSFKDPDHTKKILTNRTGIRIPDMDLAHHTYISAIYHRKNLSLYSTAASRASFHSELSSLRYDGPRKMQCHKVVAVRVKQIRELAARSLLYRYMPQRKS